MSSSVTTQLAQQVIMPAGLSNDEKQEFQALIRIALVKMEAAKTIVYASAGIDVLTKIALSDSDRMRSHARRSQQLYVILDSSKRLKMLLSLLKKADKSRALKSIIKPWVSWARKRIAYLIRSQVHKLNTNSLSIGIDLIAKSLPNPSYAPGASNPRDRSYTADPSVSGSQGPDEPDPDPDPERPYLALGIDLKATTPAGPPAPVSLRLFPYRIEMRCCHDGHRTHPQNADPAPS